MDKLYKTGISSELMNVALGKRFVKILNRYPINKSYASIQKDLTNQDRYEDFINKAKRMTKHQKARGRSIPGSSVPDRMSSDITVGNVKNIVGDAIVDFIPIKKTGSYDLFDRFVGRHGLNKYAVSGKSVVEALTKAHTNLVSTGISSEHAAKVLSTHSNRAVKKGKSLKGLIAKKHKHVSRMAKKNLGESGDVSEWNTAVNLSSGKGF